MPELPEVETIKRYLNKAIVGQKIAEVEVLSKKQFSGRAKDIKGTKVIGLERRAKHLIVNFDNANSLLIHLKMTGQLVWTPRANADLPGKTTRIIIRFDKGTLFFNDMRKFGWIRILNKDQLDQELKRYGPEPFSKDFSIKYLQSIFQKTSKPIKTVLLDQEKIAGLGNIYANEALFEAKINPRKPAKALNQKEISRLKQAIVYVLKQGIKYEGSSAADEVYIKPDGSAGRYQQHFLVYQKQKQKCQKCGATIKRVNLGGRGTFFCPKCQV